MEFGLFMNLWTSLGTSYLSRGAIEWKTDLPSQFFRDFCGGWGCRRADSPNRRRLISGMESSKLPK
jgi:hypothetical protein